MKTGKILILLVIALLAGLVIQPMISTKLKKEIDPLDEDAVFLVNAQGGGSNTYGFGDDSKVVIKIKNDNRYTKGKYLSITLDGKIDLFSETWSKGLDFNGPFENAKNLEMVWINGHLFKKSSLSLEQWEHWSEVYHSNIKKVVKSIREMVDNKINLKIETESETALDSKSEKELEAKAESKTG